MRKKVWGHSYRSVSAVKLFCDHFDVPAFRPNKLLGAQLTAMADAHVTFNEHLVSISDNWNASGFRYRSYPHFSSMAKLIWAGAWSVTIPVHGVGPMVRQEHFALCWYHSVAHINEQQGPAADRNW